MNDIGKRLIGKTLVDINWENETWGLTFSDGSAMTVYTEVGAHLHSALNENLVTNCVTSSHSIEIVLGKNSKLTISLDESVLVGPEFFVFRDEDGTTIVEQ